MPLHAISIAGSLSSAVSSPECLGQTPSPTCLATTKGQYAEEDWFSLLQVSLTNSGDSGPRKDVSGAPMVAEAVQNPTPSTDLALRKSKLKSRISRTRVYFEHARDSLAAMEAELALIESNHAEEEGPSQREAKESPETVHESTADSSVIKKHSLTLLEQPDVSADPVSFTAGSAGSFGNVGMGSGMSSGMGNGMGSWMGSFNGIISPQIEATESYVIGQGCRTLTGIERLGGPAALPNMLANKVNLYNNAGYKGYKLRDMVSNAFSTDLPGTGPWNVAAGAIDWNLYHEQGKVCTVAVKLPEWGLDWIVYGAG